MADKGRRNITVVFIAITHNLDRLTSVSLLDIPVIVTFLLNACETTRKFKI